jgi:RimJ/RimL family protein N-acetyltransferase
MTDVTLRQPELTTPRLRLRPLRPADAALLELYCSDAGLARMTSSIPHPYPPGLAEAYIARVTGPRSAETAWALDTGEDEGNGLVGVVLLKAGDDPDSAEIGYWVASAFRNAGYAGEAIEAVKAHAAGRGLRALTAQVFQDNDASARVLARAGFAHAGDAEGFSVARGAMVPTFRYRLDLEPAP